ncbi:MAG TPA: diaminopimelate epimerase [Desulfobulbaceae bacterium]|nr:diaminopimelate epimerase [Desulfobulbaceae bacterium]
MQTPLPFVKMSGTGNDFILIDHRRSRIAGELMPEFARLVCRRRFSVGADGLIFIENSDRANFQWRFFNGDGSEAEMCGNGARCAARFAYMQGIAPAHMRFVTLAGIIEAKVADVNVSILMTPPKNFLLERRIALADRTLLLHSVDTGVPHAVLFVDNFAEMDICALGREIRFHPDFMPAGTNVNFVQFLEGGALKVRTYERGVENETLACGTGATAAALLAAVIGKAASPVDIVTSGGERLAISFELRDGPAATNVFLKGPAHVIYNGELSPEALL